MTLNLEPTVQDVREYRDENGTGLAESRNRLIKQNVKLAIDDMILTKSQGVDMGDVLEILRVVVRHLL